MPLPNNFNPTEQLQDLLKRTVNQEVREWFRDVTEDDLSTPRSQLRVGCTHRENDTMEMTLGRLMLFYNVCGADPNKPVLTVPEWWAVRPGADRSQFVILFAEVYESGKLGNGRWSLTIPHYNRPKGAKPSIPRYRKGNWTGTLTLSDNSKIRVNCATASECKRVLNKLKILVAVQYRTVNGKAIKPTIQEHAAGTYKEVNVIPVRGDFYKQGQKQGGPNWAVRFRD
jgi:hypothetical protein